MTRFYQRFGVGALGLHRAFGIEDCGGDVRILPLGLTGGEQLCDVIGYESAKKKLVENTESFLNGRRANNCLLYGAAGTGKSTSVKALAKHYYGRGLRIIEVYKHQLGSLRGLIANNCLLYGAAGTGKSTSVKALAKHYYGRGLRIIEVYKHQLGSLRGLIARLRNRNYKFILYMDDLSFEEFEVEYKYLKALIEGGLEKRPDNLLIYATSNRRHLIRENFSDKRSFEEFEVEYKYLKALIEGGLEKRPDNLLIYATSNRRHLIRENFSDKRERGEDMHAGDTVQEKLSLSARFGVTIYYGEPDKKEFEEIVRRLHKSIS